MSAGAGSGGRSSGDARVVWLTAFVDLPEPVWQAGVAFWLAVTDGHLSALRGSAGEFATLLPPDGDPYLCVQRLGGGTPARLHLDVHVGDLPRAAAFAESLGAVRLHDAAHVVLRSPGGFVFCLVPDRGETVRPRARDGALVDQLTLDLPPAQHDAECAFWSALTGWELRAETPAEFSELVRPDGMPLRILLQRLGADADADGRPVHAHLDLAAGGRVEDVVARHTALGAQVERRHRGWVVLVDPAGLRYCVTARDPATGR